jgi:hypothetical protein
MYVALTVYLMICSRWGNGVNVSLLIFDFSTEAMHSTNCQNCDYLLSENDNFCPSCGQAAHIHRFSIGHLLHEFFHAFTHADKGILLLLKGLATNPGKVLREYIIEGKRKKYFNPITALLMALAFSVFMNGLLHPFRLDPKPDPVMMAKMNTPQKQHAYLRLIKKQANANDFIEKKPNWVMFFSLPLISFGFWLLFKKSGLNFAEHLVAYILMEVFLLFITYITIVPLLSLYKDTKWYLILSFLNFFLQVVYFAWAYKGFLSLNKTSDFVKVVVASLLGYLFFFILFFIVLIVYLVV